MARRKAKEIKSLRDLTPDDNNANRGTERGSGMLEESLRTLGAGRSVLADRQGKVIAGNKTVEQAASLGLEHVIVVPTDGRTLVVVQRTDLDLDTDPQARALAVADNRVAQVNLDWDPAVLESMRSGEVNLAPFWFEDELTRLIDNTGVSASGVSTGTAAASSPTQTAPGEFKKVDEDLPTKHTCPRCEYEF